MVGVMVHKVMFGQFLKKKVMHIRSKLLGVLDAMAGLTSAMGRWM